MSKKNMRIKNLLQMMQKIGKEGVRLHIRAGHHLGRTRMGSVEELPMRQTDD